ncbi:MAG: FAD-binding oxidoreductase [Steroidobacteraceae bacterium]|jgi:D-lactate dehydrogenase (cytochrome)
MLTSTEPIPQLRRALAAKLPPDTLLEDPEQIAPYLIDHRRLYQGQALTVALPRTTEEVATIVAFCNQRRIGLVPQGGNTGYCGGATPDATGRQVVLGLSRMNRIRAVDAANDSMTVEAGCILTHVQEAAAAAERYFPLSLGSEGSCHIGGNLATNAGGLNVLRFGMARHLTLGIEAVLADGRIYRGLRGLRKDNTGYNLNDLLVGSEGTLGIITAATLRLYPRMRNTATAFVALADLSAVVPLLTQLRATAGETLSSYELIPRIGITLTTTHIPGIIDPLQSPQEWYVLCELASAGSHALEERLAEALSAATDAGLVFDAALASSERQRLEFWRLRESIPEAQRHAGPSLKHDVSVPLSAIPEFIRTASQWVSEHVPEATLVCYGHAGDGNLHFNINRLEAAGAEAFLAREPEIKRAIHDLVAAREGSISAEHGIGQLKVAELERYAPEHKLAMMRVIKRALDPRGILNPGKVLAIMP